ncbi:MAG: DUF3090 domain-containing protein [Actinobacteria bacterium]|nr:DUF3090 domain-containing protein [Actinomycetota bacterium]
MSTSFELETPDRLTAGAVGEPGRRIFYLQAAGGGQVVTLLVEKEQVQALAETINRLLAMLPDTDDEGPDVPDEDLDLAEPLVPEWRAGSMALDYDAVGDRIVLVIQEVPEEDAEDESASLRVVATRAQAQALADRGEEVCASGRPRCRICGLPMDPEGHVCPALNGHRETAD